MFSSDFLIFLPKAKSIAQNWEHVSTLQSKAQPTNLICEIRSEQIPNEDLAPQSGDQPASAAENRKNLFSSEPNLVTTNTSCKTFFLQKMDFFKILCTNCTF